MPKALKIIRLALMAIGGLAAMGCGGSDGVSTGGAESPTAAPAPTATAKPATAPTATSKPATTTAKPVTAPTATSKPATASLAAEYAERGEYPVGVREVWFHDPNRPFDGWNAKHASDGYKRTLSEINAAGERQIVAALMWYPARDDGSARVATFDDLTASASAAFAGGHRFIMQSRIASLEGGAGAGRDELARAVEGRVVNSLLGAPVADGRFPIVIAAHGLGGSAVEWVSFAEYFASRGYVVVAPGFVSDSSAPKVFDSPDSKLAQSAGANAVNAAYGTILGESKVIPGFYKYFFGQSGGARAVEGGGEKVGEMMAEFFVQRVGDVETIIAGLDSLDKGAADCAADYEARSQPVHGADICGAFAGALDLDSIGVAGHSLGSMTAQFAVAKSERVAAAVGYNNGAPRYWEPPGIFGDGRAQDGQPAGNPKPVMQIYGSEDAFVQGVFRGLMWNTLSAAGGNPEDIWVLEGERALPTDENPQPVAQNAYNRATGDKAIILVKDLDHDALIEDFPAMASRRNPLIVDGQEYWARESRALRKAVGEDVLDPNFRGEPFTVIGWRTVGGEDIYIPTFVRNYYTRNWFDYYLKGDADAGRRATEDPIADTGLLVVQSEMARR